MDFYPDLLIIAGQEYKAQRSAATGIVLVPYKDKPDVTAGDVIAHKSDSADVSLKVLELSFRPSIGTFTSANKTPHMLNMKVEVTSEAPRKAAPASTTTATLSNAVVDDDDDASPVTITLTQLVQRIAMGNDGEAQETMKKLLQNRSVTGLLGSGANSLLKLL